MKYHRMAINCERAVYRQMFPQWRWLAAALLFVAVIARLTTSTGDRSKPNTPDDSAAIAPALQSSNAGLEAPASNPTPARIEVATAEVVTIANDSADVTDALFRAQVVAGRVTRDEVGPGYDALILGLARERLAVYSQEQREDTIAKFCGFKDWEALHVAISEAEPNAATRNELIGLLDEAAVVTGTLEQRLADCWAAGYRLEVFDPEGAHDSNAWIAARGLSGDKGNFRISRSARVGDRQFCLHFSSVDYPGLDYAVSGVRERAKSYSERWR